MTNVIKNFRIAQVQKFIAIYEPELLKVVKENPQQYTYPVSSVPGVVTRMQAAFLAGSYNHDGLAIKRTCQKLGIKHTRKAMEEFFNAVL